MAISEVRDPFLLRPMETRPLQGTPSTSEASTSGTAAVEEFSPSIEATGEGPVDIVAFSSNNLFTPVEEGQGTTTGQESEGEPAPTTQLDGQPIDRQVFSFLDPESGDPLTDPSTGNLVQGVLPDGMRLVSDTSQIGSATKDQSVGGVSSEGSLASGGADPNLLAFLAANSSSERLHLNASAERGQQLAMVGMAQTNQQPEQKNAFNPLDPLGLFGNRG